MSEKYLIEKQYLENAIYRVFLKGNRKETVDSALKYSAQAVDNMLRGDKPFNGDTHQDQEEIIDSLTRELDQRVTLLDQFAIGAFIGIMSNDPDDALEWEVIAEMSYRAAKVMITERNKQGGEDGK